jgi:hypothetical protein
LGVRSSSGRIRDQGPVEDADNVSSEASCRDYCDKKFDCEDYEQNTNEIDACVNECRDSIEDNCGNNHQADAKDKIDECVDRSCIDFWSCMVFDAAPSCFNFVHSN